MEDPLIVKTVEYLDGDYGMYTWPCAPVLAQYVYAQRDFIRGKRVLELGAGTAVPGVVAARCGAHVTLSDHEGNPQLLENLKHTCTINGVSGVEVMAISWGVFSPTLLQLEPQDVILASDCFYDSKDFEDILATVAFLIEKNPDCRFWTTYQERSSNRSLSHLLERWGLCCNPVPLESFQWAGHCIQIEGMHKLCMRDIFYPNPKFLSKLEQQVNNTSVPQ